MEDSTIQQHCCFAAVFDVDEDPFQKKKKNCISFKKFCETCSWTGGHCRVRKIAKPTAEAFIVSTRANIQTAQQLLTEYNFKHMLPEFFADEALEKFLAKPNNVVAVISILMLSTSK